MVLRNYIFSRGPPYKHERSHQAEYLTHSNSQRLFKLIPSCTSQFNFHLSSNYFVRTYQTSIVPSFNFRTKYRFGHNKINLPLLLLIIFSYGTLTLINNDDKYRSTFCHKSSNKFIEQFRLILSIFALHCPYHILELQIKQKLSHSASSIFLN